MDSFVFNLSGTVRHKTFGDATYLVADATLIVPGVLNGSRGPLYYPADEVGKNAEAWNDTPILVNHPPEGKLGKDVLTSQGIGHVANSRVVGHRLKASLWFNIERTKKLEPRIHDAVSNFQKMELSTGLGMDAEEAAEGAVFNHPTSGPQKYTHIVRNYRPDHVAILAEQIGACSVQDGCGVNNQADADTQADSQSSTANKGGHDMALTEKQKQTIVDELISNDCCWEEEHRDDLSGLSDVVLNQTKAAADKQAVSEAILAAAQAGFNDDRDSITFNQEKKAWEREAKPAKKDEETAVDNAKPAKQQTREEFLATAPDEVLNALAYAEEAEQAERKKLIEQLTVNVGDDAKPGYVADFSSVPIPQLRRFLAMLPPADTQSRGPHYYGGQPAADAGPTTNEVSQEGQLTPPEMDWTASEELANA